MDAYTKMLQDEHQREEIHIFSSLFFTKLTQSGNNTDQISKIINYDQVKSWTEKINLFDKEYIITGEPLYSNTFWKSENALLLLFKQRDGRDFFIP
jgi:Ulp1 family protease